MVLNQYSIAAVVGILGLVNAVTPTIAEAKSQYQMPRNLKSGWHGNVQLGALATFGVADTSAISARTDFTYRGKRVEHEFNAKYFRSTSDVFVSRRDEAGSELTDASGVPIKDRVRTTTNNRQFFTAQPRWFFSSRYYLFALLDFEANEPADIELSTRQIGGVGYKLYKKRNDYISAAIGVGRKRLVQVSGESDEGAIGYLGVRLKRALSDNTLLAIELDSDFGGENRFSEAEVSLSWKLRDPVAVKFKYEARFNSRIINPLNTFDDGVEAALSVNLEVEVF